MSNTPDIPLCEAKLGYSFANKRLLIQALTHPSHTRDRIHKSYERLEFLGDSVLNLLTSNLLYQTFPDEDEGALAKRRTGLVRKASLAELARSMAIADFLTMSAGEEKLGGRDNDSNLENMIEAIAGAAYLDGGMEAVVTIFLHKLKLMMRDAAVPPKDAKTALQEWSQEHLRLMPTYQVIHQEGPAHAPQFTVSVTLQGQSFEGKGVSKKQAEQLAAELALKELA